MHTTPLFLNSHFLPFEKLVILNNHLFIHSITFNYAALSFTDTWKKDDSREIEYQLRNQDLFVILPFRIEQFRKIPLFSLLQSWKELPNSLRSNQSTFKIARTVVARADYYYYRVLFYLLTLH